jgi:predicted phosphate transport protein (TIGR00153 family)
MRLSLVPENRRFYDLIEAAGENMAEAVKVLNDLIRNYTDVDAKLERLHDLEHKGDQITQETMHELNKTFITPFDREDIAFLTRRIDDVVDFAWAAAVRFQAYSVKEVTPTAVEFGELIHRQSEILRKGLGMLRNRQAMHGIFELSTEIHGIENKADEVLRKALAKRFNSGPHTVETLMLGMKWSEIYGILEKATDRAEDIADTLQAIALKYS